MIRRYVARARGRALRAVGAPRVPNAPSPRALAQRELRAAARLPVGRTGTRRSSGTNGPDAADRHRTEDVGTLPLVIALLGVALAVWLLVTVGTPADRPTRPPATSCYDRVIYHNARLSDC